jgi:hypothetical protein
MFEHTAARYRVEAARMRAQATEAMDLDTRRALIEIAERYERLAAWAERRDQG